MFRPAICFLLLASCGGHPPRQDNRPPLIRAIAASDLDEVKRLLDAGIDPNGEPTGAVPLTAGLWSSGRAPILRALLAAGANPDGRPPSGGYCWVSPLVSAAQADQIEYVQILLDAGAHITPPPCSTYNLGYISAPILQTLAARGFDLKSAGPDGRNALHRALAPPTVPYPDSIRYLIEQGVPLNARDAQGHTPLYEWRQPRQYETEWLWTRIESWLIDDPDLAKSRERRQSIEKLLRQSGAQP